MRKYNSGQMALAAIAVLSLLQTGRFVAAAPPMNACSLLTQSQIAAALGVEVDPGKNLIGAGDCRWIQKNARAGSDGALLQVNLIKAQSFEIGKTPLPNWTKSPITGLGDEAYSADRGGRIIFPISPSLSVRKGAAFVVIIAKVPMATIDKTKAVEKAVANIILEKL